MLSNKVYYCCKKRLLLSTRVKNRRTVAEGITNNNWLRDVPGTLAYRGARECLALWAAIQSVDRAVNSLDVFSWPWSRSGAYTASSTYGMLMQGQEGFPMAEAIWQSGAPPKTKLFLWLAVQKRIWTSDRWVRHGLQRVTSSCFVCL